MRAVVVREDLLPAVTRAAPGPLAVIADAGGVGARLVARLHARGADAVLCASPDALDGARGVVFLPSLDGADSAAGVRALHLDVLRAAQRAALDLAWVTVTALGGDFGLRGAADRNAALIAGVAGFTKTVALEHPSGFVRAIDLAPGDADALAAQIDAELGRAGPVEVGVSADGERSTLVTVEAPLPPGRPAMRPSDVIVVSGGARGVTAACLVALAKAAQPRLVLLGRSRIDAEEPPAVAAAKDEAGIKKALFSLDRSLAPAELGRRAAAVLAAREARANLAAMAAAGSQATYVAVDVSDAAAVATVLDEVRRSHGPITGFVHGAGVIQDKRVREKTVAQYTAVLSTKLDGLLALLDATASDPLRWIVLFSSVAARGGNVGQCDYALANEALNRVAAFEAATRPGCVVRSIGWGPWEGGMVTPALAKQFHAMGVPLLPIDAGAETFVRELAAGPGPTESIVGGEIAPPRERARALRIDASTAPRLVDHALAGSPVVPAVMAADALWRIAQDLRPRQRVGALRDLRVLKGIALRRWAAEGDVFELLAEVQGDERSIGVTLRTPDGPTHYHAVAELDGAASPPSAPPPLGDAAAWPRSMTTIYAENDLFHGPSFQALREVRVGDAGLDAVLADGAALGWDPQRGALDVPMFDGAVQLAALWTRHRLGGASLPTRIQEIRRWSAPAPGPATARVRPVRESRSATTTDITLVDANGAVFATLRGVEMHALPSGRYPTGSASA